MSRIRNQYRTGNVPNSLLNNPNISLKAKGLYAFMDSKPENWEFSMKGIVSQIKESYDAVRSAINELEESGYLTRHQTKNGLGQWDCDYELFFDPSQNPNAGKPYGENPHTVKSVTGKPADIVYKDISTIEEEVVEERVDARANEKPKTENQEVHDIVMRHLPQLSGYPHLYHIVDAVKQRPHSEREEYVIFVAKNKDPLKLKGWSDWYVADFWAFKNGIQKDAKVETWTAQDEADYQDALRIAEKYKKAALQSA